MRLAWLSARNVINEVTRTADWRRRRASAAKTTWRASKRAKTAHAPRSIAHARLLALALRVNNENGENQRNLSAHVAARENAAHQRAGVRWCRTGMKR